ncbi:MAG TPA: tetratricopeptide repeat protein, partial [Candidatus Angelobacter sp.]|nr:tetratricopeptide repeat protein [Candidatus Angelobacter sp.]
HESERMLGPSAPTSYNLGLCELGLGHDSAALDYINQAIEQDPGFKPAEISRQKLDSAKDRNG